MNKAVITLTASALCLFLAGCLTPAPKTVTVPTGPQINPKAPPQPLSPPPSMIPPPTVPTVDRGVRPVGDPGWTSSTSLPPMPPPVPEIRPAMETAPVAPPTAKLPEPGPDWEDFTVDAPTTPNIPAAAAGGAPTPDQLARELKDLEAPPAPEVSVRPTPRAFPAPSSPPLSVPQPQPPVVPKVEATIPAPPSMPSVSVPPSPTPSVTVPPPVADGGFRPFTGSVIVDEPAAPGPVAPSVEDIANQYRNLNTTP